MPYQAAEKAGKPYEWRVDMTAESASVAAAVAFPHLLATVEGCLHPDPNRRTSLSHLCKQLAAIRRDLTTSRGRESVCSRADSSSSLSARNESDASMSTRIVGTASSAYDSDRD